MEQATANRDESPPSASGNGGDPVVRVEVAIIGSGFGGLGTAIRLRQDGFDDFVVLEREHEVGGTWRDNTYPGCQCDVPSNLYSFSFAPNTDWSRSYPEQPQILAYLRDCAERFGVRSHVRFGHEVTRARWSEAEHRWTVTTTEGTFSARFLVSAAGLLADGVTPDLPGAETFDGLAFHTSDWDHDHDMRGRRVAMVGTGATAIQVAPRIQPQVEKLTVFQRTPPWIIPHPDRQIGDATRAAYRVAPFMQRFARAAVYWMRETLIVPFATAPKLAKVAALYPKAHMRRQVPDKSLRKRLTPGYALGCKRLLLSNEWYPMLQEPNVELVDEALAELRPGGGVAADGSEHEFDTLIFATGFRPTDPPITHVIEDDGGVSLRERWDGRPHAHLGTTIPGFPNFFMLYGPNLNLANTSIVFMLEAQIDYMLSALDVVRGQGATRIEPRRESEAAWNRWIQRELEGTVWNDGGCASWYLDEDGHNSIMWPDFTFRYWQRTRTFDPDRHLLGAGASEATPSPPASV